MRKQWLMATLTTAALALAAVTPIPVTRAFGAPAAPANRSSDYQHGPVFTPPVIPGQFGLVSDIVFVDAAANRLYLSDDANAAVDVWNARTGVFLGAITGGFTGEMGFPGSFDQLGPNGVLVDDMHQVWAGNGNGTVKVGSTETLKKTDSIPTGSVHRADELAYDPNDRIILVTNPSEGSAANPAPFVTLIDARPLHHQVLGHILIPGAGLDSVEQPQYDRTTGRFLVSVRETTAVKNGTNGAVAVIDPEAMKLDALLPLSQPCHPAGMALGPDREALLGCDSAPPVIIDRVSGAILATRTEACCADEVWFNKADGRYYAAEFGNPDPNNSTNPVVMVINAKTHAFITNLPIRDSAGNVDLNFHAVAAAFEDTYVYVPQSDGVHVLVRSGNQD